MLSIEILDYQKTSITCIVLKFEITKRYSNYQIRNILSFEFIIHNFKYNF